MKLYKSDIAVSVVFAAIFACVILLQASATTHASDFMDLELSIKELHLLVDKSSPSLVSVIAYDDSGQESGRGSGFFIDRKGAVIVNASVIRGAYSAEVLSRSGQYDNVMILHRDDLLDFALIKVNAANERPLELAYNYKVTHGERVVVIGLSHDLKKTVSEGLIISVDVKSNLMRIQTTKPLLAYRESKDGPLLNMSGNVIGVMSAAIRDSQAGDGIPSMPDFQNSKALNISAVKEIILRPVSTEQLHPAKSKIWSRWIMRLIETAAFSTIVFMSSVSFPTLIAIVFMIVLIVVAIQWLFNKFEKRI